MLYEVIVEMQHCLRENKELIIYVTLVNYTEFERVKKLFKVDPYSNASSI